MVWMFGVKVEEDEESVWIEGGERLKGRDIFVGGDMS